MGKKPARSALHLLGWNTRFFSGYTQRAARRPVLIYWDTSSVIKLYTAESDSTLWHSVAVDRTDERVSSALLEAELAFALSQKELRGEVASGGANALLRIFRHDVKVGRFILFPLGADVIRRAAALAKEAAACQPTCPLRTLDGLHLATAAILRCKDIATADVRMKAGAHLLGMTVVTA